MTESHSQVKKPCVWATSKERWDSFLNDPELARAFDSVRQAIPAADNSAVNLVAESSVDATEERHEESADSIGARLRAYETPVTDEVLRQSIR